MKLFCMAFNNGSKDKGTLSFDSNARFISSITLEFIEFLKSFSIILYVE